MDQPPTVLDPAGTSPVVPGPVAPPSNHSMLLWGGVALSTLILIGVAYFFFLVPGNTATPKVYRVGVLNALDYFSPFVDGFKQRMTELGYVEGENIVYDVQKGPSPIGNQDILKKFVDDKVDLILVFPTEASIEAKEITQGTEIPVISGAVTTEANNLVESLQNPGGNLTGVRFPVPEISVKRFDLLHEIAPKATRFWMPHLKDYPTVPIVLEATRPKAEALHITLIETPFSTPDEMTTYLDAHRNDPGMDAILLMSEPISILPLFSNQIYAFAEAHRIPIAGVIVQDDDRGPVFGVVPSSFEMGTLAAPMADKIFKGIPAGTIPIATPELVFEISYKVIQRLGLTVSEDLLSTASRIVH